MKRFSPSASLWISISRVAFGIFIAVGLANVQAAPNEVSPVPAKNGGAQGDNAKLPAASPHRHKKEVTLAPVKAEHYPSNPLPPVPTPKQKP